MVIESVSVNISSFHEGLLGWVIDGHNMDKWYSNFIFSENHTTRYGFVKNNNRSIPITYLDIYLRIMLADDFIRNRP